ncbi:MAG TPA: hypothetical protein VLT58_16225, partial [Polyangia bacterium]|nr:hypothetical protein [Polyangia bacterium]
GRHATAAPDLSEILDAPLFVIDWLASSIAALFGLSTPQNASKIQGIDWGRALLLVGVAAAGWRVWRLGRVPPGLWAPLAGMLAFGLVAAAYEEPGRLATASRYTYIGAVFVLLITAELAAGARLRRPAVIAIAGLAAIAVASSAYFLGHAGDRYARKGKLERAGLTAIELSRDTVAPGFGLDRSLIGTAWAPISAGPYLAAVDAYGGSLVFSEADLQDQPLYVRAAVDRTLAAALGVRAVPAPFPSNAGCKIVDARSGATTFELPAGGASLDPGTTAVRLTLGRFGTGNFAVDLGPIGPDPVALPIPTDGSTRPWEAQLSGGARVRVCPVG